MNLVEVHIVQAVPPANLNRDDTGSPKDTVFGGVRRARISSQAQKRAVRLYFRQCDLLSSDHLAVRTRLLIEQELLPRFPDRPPDQVRDVARALLAALGLGTTQELRTEYLLFVGRKEINALAQAMRDNWDVLQKAVSALQEKGKEDVVKKVQDRLPATLKKDLEHLFDGGKAVDLALFGRMLADRPEWQVEAACQVAHAISTHRVDREFDYYTAVDDLLPREQTGAGMVGDIEYYTATFYRYANVDLDILLRNLQGDSDLAARAVEAFLRAFILILPSGKQNTFAAHTLPAFVGLLARGKAAPHNLAAAFERPVRPQDAKSISGLSVEALLSYWKALDVAYGKTEWECVAILNLTDADVQYHREHLKGTLDEAIREVMKGARALLRAQTGA